MRRINLPAVVAIVGGLCLFAVLQAWHIGAFQAMGLIPSRLKAVAAAVNGTLEYEPAARAIEQLGTDEHEAVKTLRTWGSLGAFVCEVPSSSKVVILVPESWWCGPVWVSPAGVGRLGLTKDAREERLGPTLDLAFFGIQGGMFEIRTQESRELLATYSRRTGLVTTAKGAMGYWDWKLNEFGIYVRKKP